MNARTIIDSVIDEMAEYRLPGEPGHTSKISSGLKIDGESFSWSHKFGRFSMGSLRSGDLAGERIEMFAMAHIEMSDGRRHDIEVVHNVPPDLRLQIRRLIDKSRERDRRNQSKVRWSIELQRIKRDYPQTIANIEKEVEQKVNEWLATNEYPGEVLPDLLQIELPEPVAEEHEVFWRLLVPHVQHLRYTIRGTADDKLVRLINTRQSGEKVIVLKPGWREVYFVVNSEEEEMLRRSVKLALRDFIEYLSNKEPDEEGEGE